MRILFLDVDGVLNSQSDFVRAAHAQGAMVLCDQKLERLRDLLRETHSHFVISSTWRLMPDFVAHLRERIGAPFFDHHIHPTSPYTPQGRRLRGWEIDEWMANEGGGVVAYAIVDDDGDMLTHQIPHFVQTDFALGLQVEHTLALGHILLAAHARNPHNGYLELARLAE